METQPTMTALQVVKATGPSRQKKEGFTGANLVFSKN